MAGRINAASYGTCVRVCHDPVYISFTTAEGKDTYNNILANGEFVGWVTLEPVELDGYVDDVEIGWRLRRAFWGRGLATEAATAVVQGAVVLATGSGAAVEDGTLTLPPETAAIVVA